MTKLSRKIMQVIFTKAIYLAHLGKQTLSRNVGFILNCPWHNVGCLIERRCFHQPQPDQRFTQTSIVYLPRTIETFGQNACTLWCCIQFNLSYKAWRFRHFFDLRYIFVHYLEKYDPLTHSSMNGSKALVV